MKQSKSILVLLLAGVISFSSCSDTNKNFKYNKYTKADTEAFGFLKKAYEHSLFQQYVAKNYNLGAHSQKISQTYQTFTEELVDLATANDVLMPDFSADYFSEKARVQASTTLKTDSLVQYDIANDASKKETPSQRIIHSQEEIIHQLEVASRNTNLTIRHFAQEKLSELEELLEQTKSSIQ